MRAVTHSPPQTKVDMYPKLTCQLENSLTVNPGEAERGRCRANSEHIRQSRPDSGLGFQEKVLHTFQAVPSSLGSGVPRRATHSTPPGIEQGLWQGIGINSGPGETDVRR